MGTCVARVSFLLSVRILGYVSHLGYNHLALGLAFSLCWLVSHLTPEVLPCQNPAPTCEAIYQFSC